jgi:hypothetical protein
VVFQANVVAYGRDPANPLNGDAPTIKDLSGHR